MSDAANLEALLPSLPLFANVPKSAVKKMMEEKHMRFRSYASGDVIVRQGDLDTEFFVVIEGLASAYRTEDKGKTALLGSYGASDFFGEMSAISHQPRSATVKADGPCVAMMLDVTIFQLLFNDKKSSFAKLIDERYRERALAFHLMTAPIFKTADPEDLKQVAKGAELVSHPKGTVIAEEGGTADAVYLVRSGIIKRAGKGASGEDLIHDYLCDNSSFGERALTEDRGWSWTCTTLSHVDLVRLPLELFEQVFRDRHKRTRLQEQVDLLIAEEEGSIGMNAVGEQFELLVGKQTVKGTEALVIDLKKCTRCNACVESCVAVHDDRVPRLSKRGIREGDLMLSSACYNCKIPECMLSCKFGAIRRDVDGQIHIVQDNCVGCNMCESACPYGVIRMAHLLDEAEEAQFQAENSIWRSIPIVGSLLRKRAAAAVVEGEEEAPKSAGKAKAIKCDLCAGLPFEACVYNCPCGAIARRSPTALQGADS
ncbi:MAG: cyclic nucleotide-binding domain-containing protein [Planctomycetes bacterium]|nr:cyclic nucleotide-binding domain-containing protein [Planctomycetota bacterium]